MSENHVLHEVDGIKEEDNQLPRWWLATFFVTLIFGWGYWEYYHVLSAGMLPREELAADLKALRKNDGEQKVTDDVLLAAAKTPAAQTGAALFAANCASCHGEKGEGKIGPNLTDKAWLHGGTPVEIHTSISNGWPLKGMPGWKPVLGTDKVQALTAYVLTLRNTNLPGKPPEGVEQALAPATEPVRTAAVQ